MEALKFYNHYPTPCTVRNVEKACDLMYECTKIFINATKEKYNLRKIAKIWYFGFIFGRKMRGPWIFGGQEGGHELFSKISKIVIMTAL